MNQLNTQNPDHLHYDSGLLSVSVLGGIRLDGLDRLVTTLKIGHGESRLPAVRHKLDLYNDGQVEKLTRKVAERMELGTSIIAAVLNELTEELEAYRLELISELREEREIKKELSEEEKKAATDFLKSPNLLERTNNLIGQSGVVGEEQNRLTMYLIFTSRKREQPLHAVSLGSSGTGKTHLQEKVGNLIPEEERLQVTSLSENALYYEDRHALRGKVLLIEDLDGLSGKEGSGAMYLLRELMSKRQITKRVARKNSRGEQRTEELTVEGPVSVAGCTTSEAIYEDNANRSFLLYLDESEAQDERIMSYQRAVSAGKIDREEENRAAELLRNCQRMLRPVKVVNPFAELLEIPKEVFKPRRTNGHYLHFIEAVTFYHQYQRKEKADEETGEIIIETTLEDIEEANALMKDILLRKSDSLTGAARGYFEKLKMLLVGEEEKTFTNRSMSIRLRVPLTTIKRHHLDLLNTGHLKVKKDRLKGFRYEIVSYEEYRQLQEGVGKVLDSGLRQLKKILADGRRPSGPVPAQQQNGRPKSQNVSQKDTTAQETAEPEARGRKSQAK